jgi:hypothetical protein
MANAICKRCDNYEERAIEDIEAYDVPDKKLKRIIFYNHCDELSGECNPDICTSALVEVPYSTLTELSQRIHRVKETLPSDDFQRDLLNLCLIIIKDLKNK